MIEMISMRDVQRISTKGRSSLCFRTIHGGKVTMSEMHVGQAMRHAMALRKAVLRGDQHFAIKYWNRKMRPQEIVPGSIRVLRRPYGFFYHGESLPCVGRQD